MSSHRLAARRLAPLVIPGLLFAVTVGAEEARPPRPAARSAGETAWVAPVGHRQPGAADLAGQSASKDEFADRLAKINRAVDRKLQICQGGVEDSAPNVNPPPEQGRRVI